MRWNDCSLIIWMEKEILFICKNQLVKEIWGGTLKISSYLRWPSITGWGLHSNSHLGSETQHQKRHIYQLPNFPKVLAPVRTFFLMLPGTTSGWFHKDSYKFHPSRRVRGRQIIVPNSKVAKESFRFRCLPSLLNKLNISFGSKEKSL